MATVQYRPERNPLTTPSSYKLRFLPNQVAGYNELAARLAAKHPGWPEDEIETLLRDANEEIKDMLGNGIQVTLEDAFSYRLTLHARLDAPDDPLPPIDELLRVKVSPSRPFVRAVQHIVHLERLPPEEKAPVMLSAEDTTLDLNDVLHPQGVLRLNGDNLFFDRQDPDCGCTIQGTRSGSTVQTRFASISNTEVLVVPEIPAQDEPWNNEYRVSLSTRYTEHGSMRTSTYGNRLRTPLVVNDFGAETSQPVGILTGNAPAPYVLITDAQLNAEEQIRIQAIYDLTDSRLTLSLLSLERHGTTGDSVTIPGNGTYTLPGFSGSAVTSLTVRVDDYANLVSLIRSGYHGRIVDILEMRA